MKPFFYRIDAGALIDFATDTEGESITLLQFAKELRKGQSEIAFIQSIIDEAHQFINQKSEAGKKGMKNRWDKAKLQSITELNTVITNYNTDITELNTVITNDNTPVTRSSNRKEKEINKEKEKHPYRENVLLTSDEYQKLIDQYGQSHVEKMLDKLAGYKLSKGKTYKSDYGAILQWVVEAVPAPTYQVTTAPTTPQPYC